MAARETKAAVIARLEAALDAAVQENVRMAGELANMEAGTNALVDLLDALLDAWQEDGDMAPVLDAVAAELKRRRRTN
jgi:hypothetical protein